MNRRVLAAVDDIFFAAKIRGTAEALGVAYEPARDAEAATAMARSNPPSVVVADLHATRCDPFALAESFKRDPALADVVLVGFFSHVQTELRERALRAGFDHVLPRSAFVGRLPEILNGEL
jgi:PleD family two-component response regulator